jgi:hypothetical protein
LFKVLRDQDEQLGEGERAVVEGGAVPLWAIRGVNIVEFARPQKRYGVVERSSRVRRSRIDYVESSVYGFVCRRLTELVCVFMQRSGRWLRKLSGRQVTVLKRESEKASKAEAHVTSLSSEDSGILVAIRSEFSWP